MKVKKYQVIIYPPTGGEYTTKKYFSIEEINDGFCGEYFILYETEKEVKE